MTRQYSVKAGTHRWPVAVFCNIFDLACINAFALYKERKRDSISRRDFIFKLAADFREDYLAGRRARSAFEQESSRTSRNLSNGNSFKSLRTVNKIKLYNTIINATTWCMASAQTTI